MPSGWISIGHQGHSFKWFYYNNGHRKYLKKSELQLAKQLAIKKYLFYKIKLLKAKQLQWRRSSMLLRQAQENLSNLLNDPGYIELINDYLAKNLLDSKAWMQADYPKNTNHPETLIHPTVNGLMVRSKSESLIAIALSEHGIPFRYESIITINNVQYAPDFSILNKRNKRIIYWEHFGLINDEQYSENMLDKIQAYNSANIILGDNLILTFENKDRPLTYEMIHRIINQYF